MATDQNDDILDKFYTITLTRAIARHGSDEDREAVADVFAELIDNPASLRILVKPKIFTKIPCADIACIVMGLPKQTRAYLWRSLSLQCRDHILGGWSDRQPFTREIIDLALIEPRIASRCLRIAFAKRMRGAICDILQRAHPMWFPCSTWLYEERPVFEHHGKDMVQYYRDTQEWRDPSDAVRAAILRYIARQNAIIMLVCARNVSSPVSLLANFSAHLVRYIADAIADNDRALEGVP